jgi:hypothetical protein
MREEKRLDLADRRHLAPRFDRPQDALAGDCAARLRPHLAQAVGVAVELVEDVLGAEVRDDRARERRPDPRYTTCQPQLDACRRLREHCAERLDDELPAVLRVLRVAADAQQLLTRRHVPERPGQRHRVGVALLTERRAPDRELGIVGHPARPGW